MWLNSAIFFTLKPSWNWINSLCGHLWSFLTWKQDFVWSLEVILYFVFWTWTMSHGQSSFQSQEKSMCKEVILEKIKKINVFLREKGLLKGHFCVMFIFWDETRLFNNESNIFGLKWSNEWQHGPFYVIFIENERVFTKRPFHLIQYSY